MRYAQVNPICDIVMEKSIANRMGVPYKAPPISDGAK